ncbi:MutS domain V [Pedobacter steynii]|uniref:MutS domain V n=1 Tax=Pedobacter steynii TaxID=430522 RepID=A0A1H0HIY7_9SPHI|nr:DNA mismatch repair protein MutS [Pedobacter steynii]NQX42605.1 DNA mismatch repair protein MutS [Pedobacter steynii]SDO18791.1 MutS domain V [Pedobacter steynii]
MVKTKDSILNDYQNNIKTQESRITALKKKLNKIAFSRLGLFITEILIIALIINIGFNPILTGLLVVPLLLFMLLVKKQSAVQDELTYAGQLLWVYQNEADQMLFGKNGYHNGEAYQDEQHPYASDLDIFGAGSLYAFTNRCNTQKGMNLLAENFSRPNDKKTILDRQEAIKELHTHIDQTFHFRAELQSHKPEQLNVIQNKLKYQLPEQLLFTNSPLLKFYIKAVPFVMLALLALGIFLGGVAWQVFGLGAVFNMALIFFNLKKINKVYYGFTGSSNLLNAFSGTIKWTEEVKWNSTYIKDLFPGQQQTLPVSRQIRQLSKIIQAFDARLNVILAAFLNLFLLWDLKCSVNLADWHSKYANEVLEGLGRICKFEELISFATLTYNQPDWNMPSIEDTFHLRTSDVGHPLIPQGTRVLNDFTLNPHPTADIVTGSNMAGKSTFLRTIGINMVLAFAGAPVCAKEMSVSIFKVLSYMRIKDSLNDQTSTFKAELNRLKMILDAIKTSSNSLVLIDEMLRGTNSRDKYLGSKVFIEKLIDQQTPVLFATHDLQLSEMISDYPEQVRNYHFDIQINEGEMNFDYKLKHGPCTTFNAALLLKEIGLTLN